MEYDFIIGLEAIIEYDLLPPYHDFLLKQCQLEVSPDDAQSTSCSQPTSDSRSLIGSLHLVDSNSPVTDGLVPPLEHFFCSLTLATDGTVAILGKFSDF